MLIHTVLGGDNYKETTTATADMEDQTDLRLLVMKRSAVGGGATPNVTHHSPIHSPSVSYHDVSRSRGGEPLIQQVGPDFSKLSRELNRVVLKIQHQSEVASDCPMHSHDGHYHVPDTRRGSRAAEGQDRRGSRAYEGGSHSQDLRRSASAETNSSHHRPTSRSSNQEPNYQSLPRRLSSQPKSTRVDRRQSFQDFKTFRDKFTGKVDFKTTLRTAEDPKKSERERARKSRHYSEPREYSSQEERSGGYLIESDFDFRSPPTTRDNSRERRSKYDHESSARDYYAQDRPTAPRRGYVEQIYATPKKKDQIGGEGKKYQYGYHDLKSQIQAQSQSGFLDLKSPKSPGVKSPMSDSDLGSPLNIPKDPLSPRRVEFADEVFSFKTSVTPGTSRPGSRCESPNPKGILRYTNSDPSSRNNMATRSNTVDLSTLDHSQKSVSNVAVRSNTTDLSFCKPELTEKPKVPLTRPTTLIIPQPDNIPLTSRNNQPLVKIMIPDDQNDSDDTLIEEKHESEPSKENRDQKSVSLRSLGGKGESQRVVPPPLADWNRSQSFPPAAKKSSSDMDTNLRKTSDPIGMSATSLSSQASTHSEFHQHDLDLIRGDNETLRVRVGDLEKQVHDNNDEIKCLKATLAECLRRIDDIETKTKHQPPQEPQPRVKRRDLSEGPSKSVRRPHSAASFGSQDYIGRSTYDIGPPTQRGTYAPRQR